MNPAIGATLIGTGADLLGSLFGYGAKKKAQDQFDMSIEDLQSLYGRPMFNTGAIQTANRAAMFPRMRELSNDVSKRYNIDQPRAKQYFMDRLFDTEAAQLPGMLEREGSMRSERDMRLKQFIAQLRGQQLG